MRIQFPESTQILLSAHINCVFILPSLCSMGAWGTWIYRCCSRRL